MARLSRWCAALAAALAISLGVQSVPALAEDATFTVSRELALTGLAADTNLGVYWAVADPTSSDLVALDPSGSVEGTMNLTQSVTSVQALASRAGVLYVADIGDPDASRASVTVLRVGEPRYGEIVAREWSFSYSDGPHDAAAFGVSGRGNLYVITRGANPGVYRASTQPRTGVTNTLTRLGSAPAGVSDMTFLPDGSTMAVWAEGGLFLINGFDLSVDAVAPIARTGEALTLGLEQRLIMLGAGGATPRVTANQRPTGMTSISPTPTPTPTPSPSPTAPATPEPTEQATASARRTGTMLAIAGAGALAVLAGLATLLPRGGGRHPRRGA